MCMCVCVCVCVCVNRYGPPYSRELPLYGAKTIAVRDGFVTMRGQAKVPTWTLLASTVSPGANSLRLQGQVNWVVSAATHTHTHTVSHASLHRWISHISTLRLQGQVNWVVSAATHRHMHYAQVSAHLALPPQNMLA